MVLSALPWFIKPSIRTFCVHNPEQLLAQDHRRIFKIYLQYMNILDLRVPEADEACWSNIFITIALLIYSTFF